MSDESIGSIRNAELYAEDMWTLQRGWFLNDRVVHFYCELLTDKLHLKESGVLILPATAVMFIKFATDGFDQKQLEMWKPFDYSLILAPMTNSQGFWDGGNHWSLIVWYPSHTGTKNRFLHLDSLGGLNCTAAEATIAKISKVFGVDDYTFEQPLSPQQKNSSDCGLFTLACLEHIAKAHGSLDGLLEGITQSNMESYRAHVREAIVENVETQKNSLHSS